MDARGLIATKASKLLPAAMLAAPSIPVFKTLLNQPWRPECRLLKSSSRMAKLAGKQGTRGSNSL